jgi:hypothetical protein
VNLFDRDPISADWHAFHVANPNVYSKFCALAQQIIDAGYTHYSADAILHRIRWHYHVEQGDRQFVLNNNWTSRYARLWLSDHPEYAGFFETRVLKSKEAA